MYKNKRQWKAVREMVLIEGWSIKGVAKETGISRITIRKMLRHETPPPHGSRRKILPKRNVKAYKKDAVGEVEKINRRKSEWDWMHRVMQCDVATGDLIQKIGNGCDDAALIEQVKCGNLRMRNRAAAIIFHKSGIGSRAISSFLCISRNTCRTYVCSFNEGGVNQLNTRKTMISQKIDDLELRSAIFSVLHMPPSSFGFNRTTWRMCDLRSALKLKGHIVGEVVIRKIIKNAGYKWRKARIVLTSNDPDYQEKVAHIKSILSTLWPDERFFSIDEYGPFSVRAIGGCQLVPDDVYPSVPQWQKSKGSLIMTAALELSQNQVTHFYSEKKNTGEMIKMLDVLIEKYKVCKKLYISWDGASWHMSKALGERVANHNAVATMQGLPLVELAPLPKRAQFLNVIEAIFSGMSRAIIHNSDYESVEAAKRAIDQYFEERNAYFMENPRRAGRKIWGDERSKAEFTEGENFKDPRYR